MGDRIDLLQDALDAIARVGPIAREYAQKAEDGRALPAEVQAAIGDAGLWTVFSPKLVGGSGLAGMVETFEILRAMAFEDTSAAWGLFICGGTPPLLAARLPQRGRSEVFADGIVPMGGVFNPGGGAVPTDDGVIVDGRWPFASGIGYSRWVMANALRLDDTGAPQMADNGMPEIVSVVVRPEDITIVDDWHVAGLRGTGSMSFTLTGVHVPAHRTFSFFAPVVIDEAKYRLPIMTWVGAYFAGLAVGIAERTVDEVLQLLPTRVGPPTFEPASADPVIQTSVGEAIATIRGATGSCRELFARYDARIAGGEDLVDLSMAERAEVHHRVLWAATQCRSAVDDLFRLGGASAIYEPGVLQRTWRDINVLCQHAYLRHTTHTLSGRLALGLDVVAPLL